MMKKLMERFRMIRENQKKNGTKGFSMIELIIVIAVMAILIALIGTQLIPYLEKSRKTRDLDTMNAMLTAVQSVCTDYELDPTNNADLGKITTASSNELKAFETYLGYKWGASGADAVKKCTSKAAKNNTGSGAAPANQVSISAVKDANGNAAIMVKVGNLYVATNGKSGEITDSDYTSANYTSTSGGGGASS
ncbi:MAG: type II secretion system GspH family protein [Lachnospiraceae bacterium]|nr:type II secretion system GspH family protein [Lachnospiraceae bacterium]